MSRRSRRDLQGFARMSVGGVHGVDTAAYAAWTGIERVGGGAARERRKIMRLTGLASPGTKVAMPAAMDSRTRPRLADISMHLARVGLSAVALAIAARADAILLAAPASIALFFASFALMHDVAHGALGLPRRANEIALAAAGALMLMSGHALRLMHLRHHARPLADGDLEGAPARLSLGCAARCAPIAAIELRVEAFRAAKARGRAWQAAETLLNAACLAGLLASGRPALLAWAASAVALQLSMSVWAAHIPHNAPAWLLGAARSLAFTRSPVALSLAFHELHHRRPDLPCSRLAGRSPRS